MVETATALKLNLGCGKRKVDGFTGVDISSDCGADVVHDLFQFPWPFEDSSVDEVQSSHFLEHVPGRLRQRFFNELYRVMKPGATATFITPNADSHRAIQDPTHEWPPICPASYLYYNAQWRKDNELDHYEATCDFDFTYADAVEGPWALRSQEARDFAMRHYNNVALDLHVVLTKRV